MIKSFFAVVAFLALVLGITGTVYSIRTTSAQRRCHWSQVTNGFFSATAAIKTYFTGLFGSKPQQFSPKEA